MEDRPEQRPRVAPCRGKDGLGLVESRMMALSPVDAEIVRAFRRNAVHVRRELAAFEAQRAHEAATSDRQAVTTTGGRKAVTTTGGRKAVRVIDGYIQEEGWVERYRRVSTPVRRAAMENDKASLRRTLAILEQDGGGQSAALLDAARQAFSQVQAELDSIVSLGGQKISRGEMFRAWMDAAVFYDSTDKQRPYEEMVARHGKAIEAMAAQLTEEYAAAVLAVDEAAAAALGEPVILPPPERTPPPPPDPKEKGRWKRILKSLLRPKTED